MTTFMQDIENKVASVLLHSQELDHLNGIHQLIEQWWEAKQFFIEKFGSCIHDAGPVEFELTDKEKDMRLDEFIETVDYQYDNSPLANFIHANRKDFFNNRLSQDYSPELRKGMKMIRAFKFFETNETILKELQDRASMIIQENKVHGNLYLSVHPLDFLSSSENTYNWRSCHALDGDYRAGNLSYMLDSCTVICYLADPNKVYKLPRFPEDVQWNSKKWRMLLFLDEAGEAMMAGRQYPFMSKSALRLVQKAYLDNDYCNSLYWSDWYHESIHEVESTDDRRTLTLNDCYAYINHRLYAMRDIIKDVKGSRHYNDLLYSSVYKPYYCWSNFPKSSKWRPKFTIGSACICPRCGEASIAESESMVCEDCRYDERDFYYCDCCQTRVPRDEVWYVDGSEGYVCQTCYESQTGKCDACGQLHYKSNLIFSHGNEQWRCFFCHHTRAPSQLEFLFDEDEDTLPF